MVSSSPNAFNTNSAGVPHLRIAMRREAQHIVRMALADGHGPHIMHLFRRFGAAAGISYEVLRAAVVLHIADSELALKVESGEIPAARADRQIQQIGGQ